MESYLGIISQGAVAVVLTNSIILLESLALLAIVLGAIKGGRYFVLKIREALQKPEHLVLKKGKIFKLFEGEKKTAMPKRTRKANGSAKT